MSDYKEFLLNKRAVAKASGFDVEIDDINSKLFDYQKVIVKWSLRLGKSALFEECGLGKTAQQLEWAHHVARHTGKPVVILAPLAVAHQTVREGKKFNIPVTYCKDSNSIGDAQIVITNYERLHKFDVSIFGGVVLDESSILKSFTGATKNQIIDEFRTTPYKLACTATPAPNDYMEIGSHAEFLDIMPSNEMLARWFINDTMNFGSYRLKHHAIEDYWRWVTSWAVMVSNPEDLGQEYCMLGYNLPELKIVEHMTAVPKASQERAKKEGRLFADTSVNATNKHKLARESLDLRVAKARELVDSIPEDEHIILWCDTNYEADALIKAFPSAVEVRGSHTVKQKEEKLEAFSDGDYRIIITKPKIAGFGLNWQHVNNQIFVGLSFSFESTYQALRRSWRFGQERPVKAHFIYSETESNIMQIFYHKQKGFDVMQEQMKKAMTEHGLFREDGRLTLTKVPQDQYTSDSGNFTMHLGDSIEVIKSIDDNSIDFGIHSPPFSNLYIYSDSEADMGNAADDAEFFKHYKFLIKDMYRITKPGRLCAVHCKDLPKYMGRDGAAGLADFPGEIIRAFEGFDKPDIDDYDDMQAYKKDLAEWESKPPTWQYHSRILIDKDPVIEMQRTKNHGLLHKNFKSRAEATRQGMPDYLLIFRKWGIEGGVNVIQNREPGDYIGTNPPQPHEYDRGGKFSLNESYSIATWQRYASPVWWDINQTNVLNYRAAKGNGDEKHICPLQLDVIERAIDQWTNAGDVVFSPFAGIGSELYSALKMGRKGLGIELKPEYYHHAIRNLNELERELSQPTMFDLLDGQTGD